MINNSTSQSTKVSTGTTSESTIYLKKSELPKNVSSFKNDVGYISTSALENWLKTHSYLTKSEVDSLVEKANLVVIDTVNKTTDIDAIKRLEDKIVSINGEIVEIKDRLTNVESGVTTISEKEKEFASTIEIEGIREDIKGIKDTLSSITSSDPESGSISLDGYATQEWVKNQKYLTEHQDLSDYAHLSDIPVIPEIPEIPENVSAFKNDAGYLTKHQSLKDYAKTADVDESISQVKSEIPSLDGYATEEWVNKQGFLTKHQSLKDYAKKSDVTESINKVSNLIPSLDGYATESWVESQGFLTKHQSLKDYAKTADVESKIKAAIPSLDSYATQEWVEEQGFLTEQQSLEGYAKTSDLSVYAKKADLNSYAKKADVSESISNLRSDIPSLEGYATEKWVEDKGYLTEHQSLKDYAKKADLNSYAKKSDLTSALIGYAKSDDVYSKDYIDSTLDSYLTKTDASKSYLNKTDAAKTYLTQKSAAATYLAIEDYRGLKDATTISSKYKEQTLEDLEKDIDTLGSGFYIVHYNDIVIVKDHEILNVFKDGVPSTVIEWKEE